MDEISNSPFKNQIMNELQTALILDMIKNSISVCNEKCNIGTVKSLGSIEKSCLEKCQDRYVDATQVVVGAYELYAKQVHFHFFFPIFLKTPLFF